MQDMAWGPPGTVNRRNRLVPMASTAGYNKTLQFHETGRLEPGWYTVFIA